MSWWKPSWWSDADWSWNAYWHPWSGAAAWSWDDYWKAENKDDGGRWSESKTWAQAQWQDNETNKKEATGSGGEVQEEQAGGQVDVAEERCAGPEVKKRRCRPPNMSETR